MKFEKVNKNKIKVTLSQADLDANDIDFHSFMSNSKETKSLFLDVLNKAERDFGFSTENYHLRVETIVTQSGTYMFTITRIEDEPKSARKKKNVQAKKQQKHDIDCSTLIYKFLNFEDFCNFASFLSSCNITNFTKFAKSSLYSLNGFYYLILSDANLSSSNSTKICSAITEFATYIVPSTGLSQKIMESGKVVIKNNAIKTCQKYFA